MKCTADFCCAAIQYLAILGAGWTNSAIAPYPSRQMPEGRHIARVTCRCGYCDDNEALILCSR
jgi:hypothetical protein